MCVMDVDGDVVDVFTSRGRKQAADIKTALEHHYCHKSHRQHYCLVPNWGFLLFGAVFGEPEIIFTIL